MTAVTDPHAAPATGARPSIECRPEPVVYALVGHLPDGVQFAATVRESEGITIVLDRDEADRAGLAYDFVGAWLTVTARAGLETVGVTAVLSQALAQAGIACQVLAGLFHEHLVVPWDQRHRALEVLDALESWPERE